MRYIYNQKHVLGTMRGRQSPAVIALFVLLLVVTLGINTFRYFGRSRTTPTELRMSSVQELYAQHNIPTAVSGGFQGDIPNLANFQSQTSIQLLEEIRRNWLIPPPKESPDYAQLIAQNDDSCDVSSLHEWVLKAFQHKRNGFFIECGAFNGIWLSNTLHLEMGYNWTGILVEADPEYYARLIKTGRKAWTINACLGLSPSPAKLNLTHLDRDAFSAMSVVRPEYSELNGSRQYEVQCFPLTSVIAALGQTLNVDYLSLDVEGGELKILETVPWNYVYIKVITLEAYGSKTEPVKKFLKNQGYVYAGNANGYCIGDHIFVHKLFLSQIDALPLGN